MARLESYLSRLLTYKSTHSGPFRVPKILSTLESVEVLKLFHDVNPVPTHLSSLPAPSFLVPAIIEALTHSRYGSITQVVPDEADEFCATRARAYGGIVLSSDSDLLVADLGSDGSVSLFRDLSLDTRDGSESIRTLLFKPKGIAASLGLPDLLGLAFELTRDGTISFHQAIRRAKLSTHSMNENISYQDFIRSYKSGNAPENDSTPHNENKADLQPVDPRVSELLLQYQSLALKTHVGGKANDSIFQPRIYLPFLLDDPARSSAWVISTSLRTIAYSLLNLTTNDVMNPTNIAEYGRSGHRIVPKPLRLLTRDECRTHCIALTGRLKKARSSFNGASNSDFWPLYGLYELCRWYDENDKPLPCHDVLEELLKARGQGKSSLSWADIHLSMQLQGVLYSLRILWQVIGKLRIMREAQTADDSRDLLYDQLSGLPPLKELFPARYQLSNDQQVDRHWDHFRNAVSDRIADDPTDHGGALLGNQTTSIAQESKVDHARSKACLPHQELQPKRKRRKRAVEEISATRNIRNHSNNMYTVLDRH